MSASGGWGVDTTPTASLDAAQKAADEIVDAFNEQRQSGGLHPKAEAELRSGSVEQPLFVITIHLALDDDFDPADWPQQEVAALTEALRDAVVGSAVDDYDWFVTVRGTETEE